MVEVVSNSPPEARKSSPARTTCNDAFVVEVFDEISDELARRWFELEAASDLTPFQSLQFAKLWYEMFSIDGTCEPLIAVVRSVVNGRDLLLLPLCRRRQNGLWAVAFADGGISDYNAPVIAKHATFNKASMGQVWQLLKPLLQPADLVLLEKMPLTVNGRSNPIRHVSEGLSMKFGGHFVALTDHIALLGKTSVPQSIAAKLNTEKRRLEKHGTLQMETAVAENALDVFSHLCDQRGARSASLGRGNTLDDPRIRKFYQTLAVTGTQSGFCQIHSLRLDSEVLATALGLNYNGSYYLLLPAFANGRWAKHSPGNLLLLLQMQKLRAAGVRGYDFTIGDESYKARFGALRSPLLSVALPLSVKGYPAAAMQKARLLWRRRDEFSKDRMLAAATAFKNTWLRLVAISFGILVLADL